MHEDYQSLAYFMRRPTGFEAAHLVPFYQEILGLPVIRDYGTAVLFWAGEDLVFEIKCDDHPQAVDTDPSVSSCLPVFRTHDYEACRARLAAAGYLPLSEVHDNYSRTFYVLGADRLLLGFQERSVDSPLAADHEALRRWRAGETGLADLPALPRDVHYLSRIVRHVADVAATSRFYAQSLGLDEVGREEDSILHSLGDTVVLELAPGGRAGALPHDRSVLPNSFISRIHNFERYVEHVNAHDGRFSGETICYETGTKLAYAGDPEGNLVGIEDRTLWGNYVEDVEADRRWRTRAH